MTSRQRVLAAINHQKPDRLPIDLGSVSGTGIHAAVYDRLKRKLGIDTPTKVRTARNMLAEVEMAVLDRFGCDVVPVDVSAAQWSLMQPSGGFPLKLTSDRELYFSPTTVIRPEASGGWSLCNRDGTPFARMPADGFYFDFIGAPPGATIDPDKFRPSPDVSDEVLEAFAARARMMHEQTDKAVFGWGSGISLMGMSGALTDNITQGSLDEWLVMLMVEKDAANEMMDRSVEAAISRTKLLHQAAGRYIDVWGVASDDAGTQRGPMIAPEVFGEMIAPHYKKLCDWIHKHTHWKTFLHSCGSIYEYIPHWIAAGIEILNPVQISAANMEPDRLMRDFGGKIVFWGGGCETQHVLPQSRPAEIRQHVGRNIRTFDAGKGGFVFSQVHNIQPNVPVDNIIAMLEAARESG